MYFGVRRKRDIAAELDGVCENVIRPTDVGRRFVRVGRKTFERVRVVRVASKGTGRSDANTIRTVYTATTLYPGGRPSRCSRETRRTFT